MSTKRRDAFYGTTAWETLRSAVLKRDKFRCQKCGALCLGKKRGMPSPHCDHIIDRKEAPHLAMDPDNIQVLCSACHSKKTINGRHARGKPRIGLDGYIVEE